MGVIHFRVLPQLHHLLHVSCGNLPRKHAPDVSGLQCVFWLAGSFFHRITEEAFLWQPLIIAPTDITVRQ